MTGTNQTPSTLHPVSEAFARTAHIGSRAAYDELCAEAQKDHTGYWSRLAREFLTWHKPFTRALDESNAPFYRWFDDGQHQGPEPSLSQRQRWYLHRADH